MGTKKNNTPSKRSPVKINSMSPTKRTPKKSNTPNGRTTRTPKLQSSPNKLSRRASPKKAVSWTSPLDLKCATAPVPKTPILKSPSPVRTPGKRGRKPGPKNNDTPKRTASSRSDSVNTSRSPKSPFMSHYALRSRTPMVVKVIPSIAQVLESPAKKRIASPKKVAQAGRPRTKALDLATLPKCAAPSKQKPLHTPVTSRDVLAAKGETTVRRHVEDVVMEKDWAVNGGQSWFLPSYSRLVSWAFRGRS